MNMYVYSSVSLSFHIQLITVSLTERLQQSDALLRLRTDLFDTYNSKKIEENKRK